MTSSEWNGRIDPAIKTFIFKDGSDPDIMRAYKYYSEVYMFINPWKLPTSLELSRLLYSM